MTNDDGILKVKWAIYHQTRGIACVVEAFTAEGALLVLYNWCQKNRCSIWHDCIQFEFSEIKKVYRAELMNVAP